MATLQVNSPLSRGVSLPTPKIKYLKDKNVCLRIACSAVTAHVGSKQRYHLLSTLKTINK